MEKIEDRIDLELDYDFCVANGDELSSFLERKLKSKGFDISVYPFILDDYADITIDCFNCIPKREQIKTITLKILDENKISYKI